MTGFTVFCMTKLLTVCCTHCNTLESCPKHRCVNCNHRIIYSVNPDQTAPSLVAQAYLSEYFGQSGICLAIILTFSFMNIHARLHLL